MEKKLDEEVEKTGFSQHKALLFGFMEIRVNVDRGGRVSVDRKINDKALKKAILEKVREINERRKNERK